MVIKVKDLRPNPFRDVKNYPIDKGKVNSLKNSMNETSFWDNILVRPKGDLFEIAYGHHRLIALQELGIKRVDIPVRNLNDSTMLKIMANENMDDWRLNTAVVLETVKATKKFLDAEFAMYNDFNELPTLLIALLRVDAKGNPVPISDQKKAFRQIKNYGVGQTTILKFLGKNWKQHTIQDALRILGLIDDGTLDESSVKSMGEISTAAEFTKEVTTKKFNKEEQKKLSKSLTDKDKGRRQVKQEATWQAYQSKREKVKEKKEQASKERIIEFSEVINNLIDQVNRLSQYIDQVEELTKELGESVLVSSDDAYWVIILFENLRKKMSKYNSHPFDPDKVIKYKLKNIKNEK